MPGRLHFVRSGLLPPTGVPTLDGMSFRVLIAGPRQFTDYPALRAALDALTQRTR